MKVGRRRRKAILKAIRLGFDTHYLDYPENPRLFVKEGFRWAIRIEYLEEGDLVVVTATVPNRSLAWRVPNDVYGPFSPMRKYQFIDLFEGMLR